MSPETGEPAQQSNTHPCIRLHDMWNTRCPVSPLTWSVVSAGVNGLDHFRHVPRKAMSDKMPISPSLYYQNLQDLNHIQVSIPCVLLAFTFHASFLF